MTNTGTDPKADVVALSARVSAVSAELGAMRQKRARLDRAIREKEIRFARLSATAALCAASPAVRSAHE